MFKQSITAAILGSALVVSGCNTVEGAGQDIQDTGRAIERAARMSQADKDMTKTIVNKINQDAELAGLSVNVSTSKSIVSLSGSVESRQQRSTLVNIARSTSGVKSVNDRLQINQIKS